MTDSLRILITDEDPDSRVTTRKALQRARLEVAGETGYGTEAVALALEAHPDVIMIAVEEPVGRPLETAEALANALPDTPIVIYSSLEDAESVRRGMVFGARDYLVKPVVSGNVRDTVYRALEQEERRQMRRAGQLAGVEARGTVITVTGAKGGIGKSVLSANLAIALRQQTGRTVAVLDADTHFGDVATMFDLRPNASVTDVVRNIESIDRHTVREYLTPHATGVDILATPSDEETWLKAGPDGLKRIIEQLARVYEFVVVDTAGSFDSFVRACIEASTVTLLITSGDVSSIRDAGTAVRRVDNWGIDSSKVRLVVNTISKENVVTTKQLEQAIGRPVFWSIPHDRAVARSVQLGRPVVAEAGRSAASASVTGLALLIAGTRKALAAQPASAPFWRRLIPQRGGARDDSAMGPAKELPDSQR